MPNKIIIDAHCHIGDFSPCIRGGNHPPSELVGDLEKSGVSVGIIAVLDRHDVSGANDRARAACEKYEGQLYSYIYLNPTDVNGSLAELDRCAGLNCFRGVKFHPMEDVYYPFFEDYFPVYEKVEQLGLPTLWHSGTSPYSHPLQIAYVAREFPKIPFILGHFGLSDLTWECFPAAKLSDNIHVDTTANPIIPVFNEWIDRFGANRMLWGSDFPFYNVNYELMKLEHFSCTSSQKELIQFENAKRIFELTI